MIFFPSAYFLSLDTSDKHVIYVLDDCSSFQDALSHISSVPSHIGTHIRTNASASGEKTAQQLESNLSSLERKLDDLLNSFENSEAVKKLDEGNGGGSSSSSSGKVNETKGTDESEEKEGNA